MTNLSDREQLKEAVEWFTNELPELNNNAKVLVPLKYFEIFKKVAQSHLSASEELPHEIEDYCQDEAGNAYNNGVNQTLRDVTPIVARLKAENEGYKKLIKSCPQAQVCPYVKVISFTPDSELAKKVIDEQREELEACRDANVQKKKRIAELEDALKRAEGVSVEEIESCLWKQFPDLQTLTKPIAQAIHALLANKGVQK